LTTKRIFIIFGKYCYAELLVQLHVFIRLKTSLPPKSFGKSASLPVTA